MKEIDTRVIDSVVGFIASIMDKVDCNIEIDDGFTIADGWDKFVRPLEELKLKLK